MAACEKVPAATQANTIFVAPAWDSPYSGGWWTNQTITNIPGEAVGWLVAQGWQITDITYDTTTTPQTPYYAMARQSLQNWQILQGLLTDYTEKSNQARINNNFRYNDVVANWTSMLNASHLQFDAQSTGQDTHAALFLGNLGTYMDEVDGLIDANQTQLVIDAATATTALDAMDTKLTDLETNYTTTAALVETLLTSQGGYLSTFMVDFVAKLAELDANYTAHLATINALLAEGDVDLATFETDQATNLAALEAAYTSYAAELDGLLTTAGTDISTVTSEVNSILDELESDYTTAETDIDALLLSGTTALGTYGTDYNATLALLETDYTTIATALDAERTASSTALSTFDTDYNTTLDLIEPDYTAIATPLDAERTEAKSAYPLHSVAATQFLLDLGATELARINELFAASLAAQLQQLTDRGLYSSAVAADITERNARDRNEEIVALNDRLMREKWENDHKLYEQQQVMLNTQVSQLTSRFGLQQSARDRTMAGIDRVNGVTQEVRRDHVSQLTNRFGLQQSAHDRMLAGIDRVHGVKQEIWKYQAAATTGLYQMLLGVRDRFLTTKQSLYALKEANTRLNIDVQNQLYVSTQAIKKVLIDEAARLQQLQQSITAWNTSQNDRLYEQVQQTESQHLAGIDKQNTAQQDVSRVAMSERGSLLGMLQDAVKGVISGKERYSALTMQNAATLAEHKHRAIVEKMNESAARLSGLQDKHTECQRLMAYQLDERNKILIGLYGFVERRDDIPSFEALTQIATSLGDAGGGWVTP